MENLNLILSIVASIISILSATASFKIYKKITKTVSMYSNNRQTSGNNSTQIIGKRNTVK